MSAMTDYLEAEIVKHIFRTGSFTKPSEIAIALCVSNPGDTATTLSGVEVADSNSYARVLLNPADGNWTSPGTSGTTDNVSAITFPEASGSWGTISHIAICDSDAHNGGNVLFFGALSESKAIGTGDTFRFDIGDLNITLA